MQTIAGCANSINTALYSISSFHDQNIKCIIKIDT